MILVVDDDPSLLAFVSAALAEGQMPSRTASNASDALQIATDHPPDLIIVDVHMPEMDGFAFQRAYAQAFPERDTPVIFLSSAREDATVVRGLESGADDFLAKPIAAAVLRSKVQAVLRRYRRAVSRVFRGNLADLPLPALLRTCELKGLTGVVDVSDGAEVHTIRFDAGRLNEDDADKHLERLSGLRGAPFVIRSAAVDMGGVLPPSTLRNDRVCSGRLSGIRIRHRLFEIQTEWAAGNPSHVVTLVVVEGRAVWKRTTRVADGTEPNAISALVDGQHEQVERQVEERFRTAEPQSVDTTTGAPTFDELFEAGYDLYRKGDIQGAIHRWEQAQRIDPSNKTVAVNLRIAQNKLDQS